MVNSQKEAVTGKKFAHRSRTWSVAIGALLALGLMAPASYADDQPGGAEREALRHISEQIQELQVKLKELEARLNVTGSVPPEGVIVDDNFTNRRVLHGMLSRWGMRPTAVDGGRAALQAIEVAQNAGRPFPLILLDGQMPEMDGFTLAEHIKKDSQLVKATIMMLTSAGHLGDAARCRELGISAYLVKPIRQSELLSAICQLLDKTAQEEPAILVTRHTLREEKNRVRILLVEDNAINQTLAVRLLEKRGYSVSVAADGQAGVEAFDAGGFELVLMDIQMPRMDGFEATAAIREKEKGTGGHIPIVAMTAHALVGDQERCLAAGMDGYITKPIRTVELFNIIEKMLADRAKPDEVVAL
jgi:two-component system, sensor histidine kinase and response regulator